MMFIVKNSKKMSLSDFLQINNLIMGVKIIKTAIYSSIFRNYTEVFIKEV